MKFSLEKLVFKANLYNHLYFQEKSKVQIKVFKQQKKKFRNLNHLGKQIGGKNVYY